MIVNPFFFYLLQVCDGLSSVMFTFGVLALVFEVFLFAINGNAYFENEKKRKKAVKRCAISIGVICVSYIIPSKETIILMQASELLTPEVLQDGIDAIKTAINYTVSLFQ